MPNATGRKGLLAEDVAAWLVWATSREGGLSFVELAERSGVSRQTLQAWKKATREQPSAAELERVARALRVPVPYVVSRLEWNRPTEVSAAEVAAEIVRLVGVLERMTGQIGATSGAETERAASLLASGDAAMRGHPHLVPAASAQTPAQRR
jgi:transcriptional regulator with XRE-family HTH domain